MFKSVRIEKIPPPKTISPSLPNLSYPSIPQYNIPQKAPNDIIQNSKNTIYINDNEIKREMKKSRFNMVTFNIRSLTKNIMTLRYVQ